MMRTLGGDLERKIRLVADTPSLRGSEIVDLIVDRPMILVARLTSSDVGVLRRIETKEGVYGEVGTLLAVLSTGDRVSTNPLHEDLREASEFRVVTNLVE